MQVSKKHRIAFPVTKHGFIPHLYVLESGACVYMNLTLFPFETTFNLSLPLTFVGSWVDLERE